MESHKNEFERVFNLEPSFKMDYVRYKEVQYILEYLLDDCSVCTTDKHFELVNRVRQYFKLEPLSTEWQEERIEHFRD